MIIFDSTIWIDYFRKRNNPKAEFLKQLLSNNQRVYVTPTIVQEVLQGISDPNHFDVAEIVLTGQKILNYDPIEAVISGARLYAYLCKKGVTIRKPNDCLIASFALHFEVELCHNYSDFHNIAAHTELKIWNPQ